MATPELTYIYHAGSMSGMNKGLLVVALILVIVLSFAAAIQDYFLGDLYLARAIQEIKITLWQDAMEFVSLVGKVRPMLVMTFALFCWFLLKRQKAEYMVMGGALLSLTVNPMLKLLVHRPRPSGDLVAIWTDTSGMGFPSGHAATATILFGLLYYLAPALAPWKTATLIVRFFSLMMIGLIGVSRVYLGAHWPSDVLGGFLVGGIILSLLIHLHRQYSPHYRESRA